VWRSAARGLVQWSYQRRDIRQRCPRTELFGKLESLPWATPWPLRNDNAPMEYRGSQFISGHYVLVQHHLISGLCNKANPLLAGVGLAVSLSI